MSLSLTRTVAGTTSDVDSNLNNNWAAIETLLNGGLKDANVAADALIALSKLAQSGATSGQAMVWDGSAWSPATVSPVYDRKVTTTTVSNTTTETEIYSKTIAAGDLSTNKRARLTLEGDYENSSGASKTLAIEVSLGGTVIYEDTATVVLTNTNKRAFLLEVAVQNLTAATQHVLVGLSIGGADGAAPTTGVSALVSDGALTLHGNATAAIDTSAACALTVKATHQTAATSIVLNVRSGQLELI